MADMTLHAAHAEHDEAANNENRKFAMWLYLTSEVVIFSMLIAGYAVFRSSQFSAVNLVKDSLGIWLVTGNTFVLLASSYAMVMGLRAIRMGSRQGFYLWIGLTALLGVVFLGGQYIEYSELGHLGISLDKQDFTVATNIFETVNHVEAEAENVQAWRYSGDTQTYLHDGDAVAQYPIEDVRELHFYDTVAAIPSSLSNATIFLPSTVKEEDIQSITDPAARNLVILQGEIKSYHVDFEDNAPLFADVHISETAIDQSTLFMPNNEDFIVLDASLAPITDADALEANQLEINNEVRALGSRRDNLVPVSRVAVETIGGEVVPFSAVLAGQAVDLDPAQYANLNAYFRRIIGDSASNYGMRFYAPTAFHGAHVAIGVLWALIALWRGYKGYYDKNAIGLEMFGLYWHFVDVVWIVLFTLIYLV